MKRTINNLLLFRIPEKYMDPAMAQRLNIELQKLAARGLTVISTSGDLGVSDSVGCDQAYADFPSSSPFTTSVGSTRIAPSDSIPLCSSYQFYGLPIECKTKLKEIPCTADNGCAFTTGSGFSQLFSMPSYQSNLINNYIKTSNLHVTFNSSGRAYNDVSALGSNVIIVNNGKLSISWGTSASG